MATVTATATAGSGRDNKDGTVPDAKGGGAEIIALDSNNKDWGVDAGSLLMAVVRLQPGWKQQST